MHCRAGLDLFCNNLQFMNLCYIIFNLHCFLQCRANLKGGLRCLIREVFLQFMVSQGYLEL